MPPWKIWVSVGLGAVMGAGVTVVFIIFSLMNFSGLKLALVFLVGWAACAAFLYRSFLPR